MPAGGAESDALQALLRDFGRVNLRETEGPHASRAKLRQQLPQTGPTILDERVERHNLRRWGTRGRIRLCVPVRAHIELHIIGLDIKEVGLDSLVRGDGESCNVVFSCREGLDRALPTNLRISLSKETIGREIVDRDGDHKPSLPRIVLFTLQNVICQKRFLDISAC